MRLTFSGLAMNLHVIEQCTHWLGSVICLFQVISWAKADSIRMSVILWATWFLEPESSMFWNSNFMCMLIVAIDRSRIISATSRSEWLPGGHIGIYWFPDSNFSFAKNIKSKHWWHNTYVFGKNPTDFHIQNGHLVAILGFLVSGS